VVNIGGILYGTTSYYGPAGGGTVFSMTTAGAEKIIYSFGATATDANSPNSPLLAVSGVLYGWARYLPCRNAHRLMWERKTEGMSLRFL